MQTLNRFKVVKDKLQTLSLDCKQTPPDLLAVSKGQSSAKIKELLESGWRDFGESYLQELEEKAAELKSFQPRWHFIGQLQSRKIKKIVPLVESIHSVDQFKHALHIEQELQNAGRKNFSVYISVNAAAEAGKSGVTAIEALELADLISKQCPSIKLMGIMSVPPKEYNDETYSSPPKLYQELRALANQIGAGKLSLGMSSDLKIAIMAGANTVRIGTEIFGERSYS